MLHPEIDKIDNEVQTSLEYMDLKSREAIEEELNKLREDKSLLEGKIRGYLTLSDICHEYKEELTKLREDYNKLREKVNTHNSFNMETQPPRSESPTPDNDLGMVNGRELEQRTQPHNPTHHHSYTSTSINNVGSVASNILKDKELPVRTKELFDVIEDPPKSSEGTKSMPRSIESTYRDKYPMQESIALQSNNSVAGLGFEQVPSDNLAQGQSAKSTRYRQPDDLIRFSVSQSHSFTKEGPAINNDEELENILKSVQLESGVSELKKVVETVKNYSKSQHDRLQRANVFLLDKNDESQKKIKQLQDDNKRLVEKIRSLEQQVYDLSSLSRSRSPEGSAQATGWVHIQKPQFQNETVTKATESQQGLQADFAEMEMLKQKNQQLTEANQRWSNEWNKLVAHNDNRLADLQTERDRMAKELTDNRISEEARQRDYERMLMNAKKKAGEEENSKEEALLQLTSANNRAEAVQMQLAESEDMVTALRREKQVLETELSVIRQQAVTSSASVPQAPRPNQNQTALQIENDVLRQQLLVFQEDFDKERQDRAKAQSYKDDYKKQNEQYKKRVRHLEQKNINLDRQIKTAEDSNKRLQDENRALQQDISTLRAQLQREQEKTRNYVQSQMAYQPVIQSAGMQPQRQVIFGQPIQQRPQQYVIPATYEQRLPQLNAGGMVGYMPPPGSQYQHVQGVVNPPAPYYQANQAGKQTEYKVGSWSCNQCTYVNYPGRTVCEVCGYIQSPSATQNNFAFRQNGNETLHARGEPQQQQPPPFGYGGPSAQRGDIATDNINYQ